MISRIALLTTEADTADWNKFRVDETKRDSVRLNDEQLTCKIGRCWFLSHHEDEKKERRVYILKERLTTTTGYWARPTGAAR